MAKEIKMLKTQLERSKSKVKRLEIENPQLKQTANLTLYKLDFLEQYGRRENLRIHHVPKNKIKKENKKAIDDGEEIILKVAKCLNVNLQSSDIQRPHRLCKKRLNSEKPRSIIVRFVSYKKRNEILFAKSKQKNSQEFLNAFLLEDLTLLRSKLLQYVKKECNNKNLLCHTNNGNIRMKKSAKKEGLIGVNEKDFGTSPWLVVSTPDDLFKHNVDINFSKLNYQPLLFN